MATGDIVKVLDAKTFSQGSSQPAILRKRTKNIALLCQNRVADSICFLQSIGISDVGIINATPLDSLVLGSAMGRDMGLVHWHEDIFAVLANDPVAHVHLWTVSCDDAGNLPISPIDYLQLADASNRTIRSDILKVHTSVALIGETYSISPATVQTVIVSELGGIDAAVADSMDLPEKPKNQRLRYAAGNIIVELWKGTTEAIVSTYACAADGALSASPIDSWTVAATAIDTFGFVKVSNSVFAMFIRHADNSGNIHTFSIQADGKINKAYIDSEVVEATISNFPEMTEMGSGYFIVAYKLSAAFLRVKTYYIADDGTIQNGHIGTIDRAFTDTGSLFMEFLGGNIWALLYNSPGTTCHFDTLEITMPVTERPHHEMIMGIGP